MKTIIAKISALFARLNANKTEIRKMPSDAVQAFRWKATIESSMNAIRKGSV